MEAIALLQQAASELIGEWGTALLHSDTATKHGDYAAAKVCDAFADALYEAYVLARQAAAAAEKAEGLRCEIIE